MKKKRIKPFRPIYPSPAALVTSVDPDGKPNILTLAEVFNISIRKPVIIGVAIRPATYSHKLISQTREYVVNLPRASMRVQVDACGSVSGRSGMDKFEAFGLTPVAAAEVRPPLVAECPVNIECKVVGIQTIGDHDLFLGEVLAVHADEDVLDESDSIISAKVDMLTYITGEYWGVGQMLGKHGLSNDGEAV